MQNTVKSTKAITLIALVITIVVLIILAAVTINLSLSDNGIFNRAKIGKQQYSNAQEYEEQAVSLMSNQIDIYVSGRAGSSSYKIEKIGNATGTTPIPFDASEYDEIYVEVYQGSYFVFNINTITLSDSLKTYMSPGSYNGAGVYCVIGITNNSVKIGEVRRDNTVKTSVSTIEVYGIKY